MLKSIVNNVIIQQFIDNLYLMDDKNIQSKNFLYRVIYDFWNSCFVVAISTMFLAQRLILDNKVPDIRYGWSFVLVTFFVLISSPFLWARSDNKDGIWFPYETCFTFTGTPSIREDQIRVSI
jgi:hypothetical protein